MHVRDYAMRSYLEHAYSERAVPCACILSVLSILRVVSRGLACGRLGKHRRVWRSPVRPRADMRTGRVRALAYDCILFYGKACDGYKDFLTLLYKEGRISDRA